MKGVGIIMESSVQKGNLRMRRAENSPKVALSVARKLLQVREKNEPRDMGPGLDILARIAEQRNFSRESCSSRSVKSEVGGREQE